MPIPTGVVKPTSEVSVRRSEVGSVGLFQLAPLGLGPGEAAEAIQHAQNDLGLGGLLQSGGEIEVHAPILRAWRERGRNSGVEEGGDARKLAPFEHLKRGASARRDVGETPGETGAGRRRRRSRRRRRRWWRRGLRGRVRGRRSLPRTARSRRHPEGRSRRRLRCRQERARRKARVAGPMSSIIWSGGWRLRGRWWQWRPGRAAGRRRHPRGG